MDHGVLVVLAMLMVSVGISRYLRFRFASDPFVNHPKRIEFQAALRLYNAMFAGVNTGYISVLARNRAGIREDSFTYGEIDTATFVTLLELAEAMPNERFYDLGSGAGKAVFVSALFFNLYSKGVELIPELHDFALKQQSDMSQLVHASRVEYARFHDRCERIQFIHDDILNYSFYDADIIFVNASCFHHTLWTQLVDRFRYLKRGCRLIITTKKIDDLQFTLIHEGMYQMSWGDAGLRIYRKDQ